MSREVCEHNVLIERPCKDCGTARNRFWRSYPGNSLNADSMFNHIAELEKQVESLTEQLSVARSALEKISNVTQFDHPSSQIIGSEEYEGAWLDCTGLAKAALKLLGEGTKG